MAHLLSGFFLGAHAVELHLQVHDLLLPAQLGALRLREYRQRSTRPRMNNMYMCMYVLPHETVCDARKAGRGGCDLLVHLVQGAGLVRQGRLQPGRLLLEKGLGRPQAIHLGIAPQHAALQLGALYL